MIFVFIIFSSASFILTSAIKHPKTKALWNFEEIGSCRLGYNPIIYNGYGCWCGMGGGELPVDGIDRCCQTHDNCYGDAVTYGQCSSTVWEYVRDYAWKCIDNEPVCGDSNSDCQAALCECDKNVVNCWSQYPKPETKAICPKSEF